FVIGARRRPAGADPRAERWDSSQGTLAETFSRALCFSLSCPSSPIALARGTVPTQQGTQFVMLQPWCETRFPRRPADNRRVGQLRTCTGLVPMSVFALRRPPTAARPTTEVSFPRSGNTLRACQRRQAGTTLTRVHPHGMFPRRRGFRGGPRPRGAEFLS